MIVVIDDDDDLRSSMVELLEESGYSVIGFSSAEEALVQLEGDLSPSLILLDLMMPGMNGWEFRARQLTSPKLAGIPVVVVTARAATDKALATLNEVEVLHKPFSTRSLIQTLERFR